MIDKGFNRIDIGLNIVYTSKPLVVFNTAKNKRAYTISPTIFVTEDTIHLPIWSTERLDISQDIIAVLTSIPSLNLDITSGDSEIDLTDFEYEES